jgi:hypothetical protein
MLKAYVDNLPGKLTSVFPAKLPRKIQKPQSPLCDAAFLFFAFLRAIKKLLKNEKLLQKSPSDNAINK